VTNLNEQTEAQTWHKRFAMSCNNRAWDLSTHASLGLGPSALMLAETMRTYFTGRDTADWELAFTHAIYAHAAHAAGRLPEYRDAYRQAQAALGAVANEQERKIAAKTFSLVPKP
jgi:hypothetical protein